MLSGKPRMRRRACLLLSLFVLLSALTDFLPRPLSAAPPVAASSLALSQHSVNCHCKACAGGASCCCRKAANPIQAVILRAACDTPFSVTLALQMPLFVLPAVVALLMCIFLTSLLFSRQTSSIRFRAITPLDSPPRFFETVPSV
jgi:hypothetical protein